MTGWLTCINQLQSLSLSSRGYGYGVSLVSERSAICGGEEVGFAVGEKRWVGIVYSFL